MQLDSANTPTLLFIVGRCSRAIVRHVLGDAFRGWLMSDGYWAYLDLDQRLRCLVHLIRKAYGLDESFDLQARRFGTYILQVIETVIEVVYQARGAPPGGGATRSPRADAQPPCSPRVGNYAWRLNYRGRCVGCADALALSMLRCGSSRDCCLNASVTASRR